MTALSTRHVKVAGCFQTGGHRESLRGAHGRCLHPRHVNVSGQSSCRHVEPGPQQRHCTSERMSHAQDVGLAPGAALERGVAALRDRGIGRRQQEFPPVGIARVEQVQGTLLDDSPQRPFPLTHARWKVAGIQPPAADHNRGPHAPRHLATEVAHQAVAGIVHGGVARAVLHHLPQLRAARLVEHRPV